MSEQAVAGDGYGLLRVAVGCMKEGCENVAYDNFATSDDGDKYFSWLGWARFECGFICPDCKRSDDLKALEKELGDTPIDSPSLTVGSL